MSEPKRKQAWHKRVLAEADPLELAKARLEILEAENACLREDIAMYERPMTTEEATRILLERKHQGTDTWQYEPQSEAVFADPPIDCYCAYVRLSEFEAIAIARAYLAQGEASQ